MTRLPSLGPRGEGWVAVQLVILVAIALAGATGPAWSGAPRTVGAAVGIGAMLIGAVLATRGIVDLREALTPFPHPRRDGPMIEHGAYRLARHPIYGGLVIGSIGWGLVTASPLGLALAAILFAFFDLKSRREEAWLVDRFPAYDAYRRRTRRLIPFVY
jgi:protein-S-isoprenylcysteine O-methyltransferase Ste14